MVFGYGYPEGVILAPIKDWIKKPPLFPETHLVQNQKGIAGVSSFLKKLLTFK